MDEFERTRDQYEKIMSTEQLNSKKRLEARRQKKVIENDVEEISEWDNDEEKEEESKQQQVIQFSKATGLFEEMVDSFLEDPIVLYSHSKPFIPDPEPVPDEFVLPEPTFVRPKVLPPINNNNKASFAKDQEAAVVELREEHKKKEQALVGINFSAISMFDCMPCYRVDGYVAVADVAKEEATGR